MVIDIDAAELDRLNMAPETLDYQNASKIIENALQDTPEYHMIHNSLTHSNCKTYFDMFPGKDSVLIFLRFASRAPWYFAFESIENVIACADNLPDSTISSLYYTEDNIGCMLEHELYDEFSGKYILVVYPSGEELQDGTFFPQELSCGTLCNALLEYGLPLYAGEDYVLHLREHAGVIAEGNAINKLRQL